MHDDTLSKPDPGKPVLSSTWGSIHEAQKRGRMVENQSENDGEVPDRFAKTFCFSAETSGMAKSIVRDPQNICSLARYIAFTRKNLARE